MTERTAGGRRGRHTPTAARIDGRPVARVAAARTGTPTDRRVVLRSGAWAATPRPLTATYDGIFVFRNKTKLRVIEKLRFFFFLSNRLHVSKKKNKKNARTVETRLTVTVGTGPVTDNQIDQWFSTFLKLPPPREKQNIFQLPLP